MSEMIERVAKHVCRCHQEIDYASARIIVRTVIEAMREPTPSQLAAVCDPRNQAGAEAFADDWCAMIDAALK